jgi:hypothetical protein
MQNALLQEAFNRTLELPESDQERIARELMEYVDHLRSLRSDLAEGIQSLDAGLGKELDIEDVIARARAAYDGA